MSCGVVWCGSDGGLGGLEIYQVVICEGVDQCVF